METSFSNPRILEYINDGGAEHNQEIKEFLLGLAILANVCYGSVTPTQKAMLFNMDNGMSLHEAAVQEYDCLRKTIMG